MSSVLHRNCVFINSNNPSIHNQVIDGTHPIIKLPFPPCIDPYDLIVKSRDGKIPSRAPNAFIIYRKFYIETARNEGYFLPMTVISSMASRSWERESEDVKEEYRRLSKEAFEVRNEMLPKANRKRKREKWNLVQFKDRSRKNPPVFKTQNPPKVTNSTAEVTQNVNSNNPVNLQTKFTNNEISISIPSIEQLNFDFNRYQYNPEISEIYSSPESSIISSPEINDYSPLESSLNNQMLFDEELINLITINNGQCFESGEFGESIAVDPLTFSTETINMSMYSGNNFIIELEPFLNFNFSYN